MRIKKIHIQNYKSLVDFELDNPPPFCAFVGPNASGKSNIFEALEFINYVLRFGSSAPGLFHGKDAILSYDAAQSFKNQIDFVVIFRSQIAINFGGAFSSNNLEKDNFSLIVQMRNEPINQMEFHSIKDKEKRATYFKSFRNGLKYENEFETFYDNFSRVFINKQELNRISTSQSKLLPDASNVSQIIGRIFEDENKREDFIEWLRILIPEFKNIEIKKSNIDGSFEFFVYEKGSNKPFPKHLISDGTYNILSLLAAVFQSSEPQFLCIEEPENGLHPEAIQILVDLFRQKCEEEGHHIWLNTHSPTLVRCMEMNEIVLVNKIDGATRARIETNKNGIDIKTDEAWLTNALGGGMSWSK